MSCDSVAKLVGWFNDLEEAADSICGQIESRIRSETDDDVWLIRISDKLAYTRRGQSVIRRRLRELGVEVTIGNAERDLLKQKVHELKIEVTRGGLFRAAVHEIVPKDILDEVYDEVRERLESRIEKAGRDSEFYIRKLSEPEGLTTA
jgi:hypothetical protein